MSRVRSAICVAIAFAGLVNHAIAQDAGETARGELRLIPSVGGDPKTLTSDGDYEPGSPVWSPDGKQIAYDVFGPQRFADASVKVIKADGSAKVSLGLGGMPTWDPDSQQLVFHTYRPSAIAVANKDGSGRRQRIDHWGNPLWMPDGNRIACINRSAIAIFDLTTDEERIVIPSRWNVRYGISLSPNGERFAFSDDKGQLYIAEVPNVFDPDPKVTLRLSEGKAHYSSWSPDSKRLAIGWKPTQRPPQIYVLEADGNAAPERIEGQDPYRRNRHPSWSPDGETIVYSSLPRFGG